MLCSSAVRTSNVYRRKSEVREGLNHACARDATVIADGPNRSGFEDNGVSCLVPFPYRDERYRDRRKYMAYCQMRKDIITIIPIGEREGKCTGTRFHMANSTRRFEYRALATSTVSYR